MHKIALRLILLPALSAGCSPQRSFKAETFDVPGGKLTLKGWTKGELFGVEIRLDSEDKNTTLVDMRLVDPDGERLQPSKWEDETPRPFGLNLGLGLGLGWLIGSNVGVGTGLGVNVPLKSGEKASRITAVDAWWKRDITSPSPGDWALEVDLATAQMRGSTGSRVRVRLKHAAVEASQKPPKVREVDFTRQER